MYSYVSQTWKNLEKKKDRKIGNIRKIVFLENLKFPKTNDQNRFFYSQVVGLIKQFSPKIRKKTKKRQFFVKIEIFVKTEIFVKIEIFFKTEIFVKIEILVQSEILLKK